MSSLKWLLFFQSDTRLSVQSHTAGVTFYFSHSTACLGGFQQTMLPKENKLTTRSDCSSLVSGIFRLSPPSGLLVWLCHEEGDHFSNTPMWTGQDRTGEYVRSVWRSSPRPPTGLKRPLGLKRLKQAGERPRGGPTLKPPTGSDGSGPVFQAENPES